MKVLHFILGKANPDRANGVNQVINGLAKYMSLAGAQVYVLGLSRTKSGNREIFARDGFEVEVYPRFFRHGVYNRFKELSEQVDIIHFHGVWNRYNILLGRYLEKIGKPYVVTPHCGVADDRLRQSNYLLKKTYHHIFQKHLFDRAAGLQALSREEMYDISKHSSNSNLFVITNGVDVDKYPYRYIQKERTVVKIGYLGRLGKEKNIEGLISAVAQLPENIKNIVEVYIAGPKNSYLNGLNQLCAELEIADKIFFIGAKYGQEKIDFMNEMDFFVHPAFSEGGSIGIIEIMAGGLPLVVTRTSQVSYYYDHNAFIMVEPIWQDIARGIEEMIASRSEWMHLSHNARNLVENTLNWEVSSKTMLEQYEKILKSQKRGV